MWHCPHCGAPQAETARCWVCRRSSTTCSTCTHFRRALAGDLGYCGLDARRRPLTGLEQRGCWEPNPAAVAEAEQARSVMSVEPHRLRGGRPIVQAYRSDQAPALRDFVPVESLTKRAAGPVPQSRDLGPKAASLEPTTDIAPATDARVTDTPPTFVIEPDPNWSERTSLFGDPEG
jgi:hypothetical protein